MKAQATDEKAKFWRIRELRNLELLHAAYLTRSSPRHTHEGFEIGVIETGAEDIHYRGTTHIAAAGSVIVINPGEVHSERAASETGWTCRMFYPDASAVQDAASDAAGRQLAVPFFPSPVIHNQSLASLIRRLHVLLERPSSILEQESYSVWTAGQLVTHHASDPPAMPRVGKEDKAVRRVQEFIQAHSAEDVSLQQLARVADLSPFHLIRVFRNQVGLPPHAYLIQVRVNRAKSLLSLGQPIAQVAGETGFVDQSHLTKHFKRLLGITPRQYALAARTYKTA